MFLVSGELVGVNLLISLVPQLEEIGKEPRAVKVSLISFRAGLFSRTSTEFFCFDVGDWLI